tara:strand:+ start:7153 stop:7848 length:696 start_codon:yes stop_codon:yes gene_type:complete
MKKILFILLCNISLYAQVGINTTDPQAMLDIEGDLMIQEVNYNVNGDKFLVWDDITGLVSWNDVTPSPGGSAWLSSGEWNWNSYGSSVDFTTSTDGVEDAEDLVINAQVTTYVPNNRQAYLQIMWSIPISVASAETDAFVGTRLFIDGVEVTGNYASSSIFRVKGASTVTSTGIYNYIPPSNTSGSSIPILIEIRGYYHQLSSGSSGDTYKFKYHQYSKGTLNIWTIRKHL